MENKWIKRLAKIKLTLFKKNPLKEKLKQAKKRTRREKREFYKGITKKKKEEDRISTYVHNGICPECGEAVKHAVSTREARYTENIYSCTKCSFKKSHFCDDEDDFA